MLYTDLHLGHVRSVLQRCRQCVVVAAVVLTWGVGGQTKVVDKVPAPEIEAVQAHRAAQQVDWTDADGLLTRNIRFLHIPKCGTTFKRTMTATTSVCKTLMERSLKTVNGCGHKGMKMLTDGLGEVSLEDAGEDGRACCHMVGTSHQPWSYQRTGPEQGGYIYATIVRDPFARVVSAFHYGHHAYYPRGNETQQLKDLVLDRLSDDPEDEATAVAAYSSLSAIRNCQTKMLAGHYCAQAIGVDRDMLSNALDHLRALQFVGLTGQWHTTICLFHAMFGLPEPRWGYQTENTRPQDYSRYTARGTPAWAELEKLVRFNEQYDEQVYTEGEAIFYRNLDSFPQCKSHLTHRHR